MVRLTEWNREHTHGQLVKGDGYTKLARYEDTGLEPEDVERLKGCMQPSAIQDEPLTLEELREMDGQPVWVELADGRQEYGLVCIEEFGAMIYVRLKHDTFLAYNHDEPNKPFWSKMCRRPPVRPKKAGKEEEIIQPSAFRTESREEETDMGRMSDIAIECGSAPMPPVGISIIEQWEKKYGFAKFDGPDGEKTYILLQLPDGKQGREYVNLGKDCVAAHGLRVNDDEGDIPLGEVSLLIWESVEKFNRGSNPIASISITNFCESDSADGELPF